MKKGYGGYCRIKHQDYYSVTYEYFSYKNEEEKNEKKSYDGTIIIAKDSLVAPEIRTMTKRSFRNGKTIVETPVPVVIHYPELFDAGRIRITNCTNCWKKSKGRDFIAVHLVFNIYNEFQETGQLPKETKYEK